MNKVDRVDRRRRAPAGARSRAPVPLGAVLGLALGLAGCATHEEPPSPAKPSAPPPSGASGADSPYKVDGSWYYPRATAEGYREVGLASWYGRKFHGKRTASGDIYDMHQPTAAHRTLPLPTMARVTNLENGRSTKVRINDRGPFVDTDERIIDLSYGAAKELGVDETGLARVRVVALEGPPSLASGTAPESNGTRTHWGAQGPPGTALYLQVGAFHHEPNAARLKERLRGMDLQRVVITLGRFKGRTVYRVRIGPLSSVATAERLAQRLRRRGMPGAELVRQ